LRERGLEWGDPDGAAGHRALGRTPAYVYRPAGSERDGSDAGCRLGVQLVAGLARVSRKRERESPAKQSLRGKMYDACHHEQHGGVVAPALILDGDLTATS